MSDDKTLVVPQPLGPHLDFRVCGVPCCRLEHEMHDVVQLGIGRTVGIINLLRP